MGSAQWKVDFRDVIRGGADARGQRYTLKGLSDKLNDVVLDT